MAKYQIVHDGLSPGHARLISHEKLSPQDFADIAAALGVAPIRARKIGFVAARKAKVRTEIETRWNGKESSITAEPGDWIVYQYDAGARTHARRRRTFERLRHLAQISFRSLYTRDKGTTNEGSIYRAVSKVEALFFPGGFEIMPPWGETQRADAGYILLNGDEVYGNAKETFEATYVVVNNP